MALHQDAYVDANKGISAANVAFYQEQGFLIAPEIMPADEMDAIRAEAVRIFRGERGQIEGLQQHAADEPAEEVLKGYNAIHFPHKISPVIRGFLDHPKIVPILEQIISPNVKCMQSMLFIKAPRKLGQSWHQDEYFIPTRDCSLTGGWIAVDDANLDNGCLWVIPGSHKPFAIRKRVPYTGDQYTDTDLCDLAPYTQQDAIPVEVKSGSVVFFNGYLLHSSLKNQTENKYRTALVNHYMSAESMLPWDMDGLIPMREDMRDIVMVAGEDPYAHKGTEDLSKPFLRPEKANLKEQGKQNPSIGNVITG